MAAPGIQNLALHRAPYLATLALRLNYEEKDTATSVQGSPETVCTEQGAGDKGRSRHSTSAEAVVPRGAPWRAEDGWWE